MTSGGNATSVCNYEIGKRERRSWGQVTRLA